MPEIISVKFEKTGMTKPQKAALLGRFIEIKACIKLSFIHSFIESLVICEINVKMIEQCVEQFLRP